MKNQKDLTGITVADLLLQIQDAQNKIQEAQKQISETLEAIQAIQAQEPEVQETQQTEEELNDLGWTYLKRWHEAYEKGWGEAGDEMHQMAKRLEELEKKCCALGNVAVEFDGFHTAKHLRGLAHEMSDLDTWVMNAIEKENFEEVEKKIEWVASGRYKNDGIAFPENMENAQQLVDQYEAGIKDWEKRYGDSSKVGKGTYAFG